MTQYLTKEQYGQEHLIRDKRQLHEEGYNLHYPSLTKNVDDTHLKTAATQRCLLWTNERGTILGSMLQSVQYLPILGPLSLSSNLNQRQVHNCVQKYETRELTDIIRKIKQVKWSRAGRTRQRTDTQMVNETNGVTTRDKGKEKRQTKKTMEG